MRAFAVLAALLLALTLAGCSSRTGEAAIHGKVVDGGSQPVAGATVEIDGGDETTTAADGTFHFTGLAEGEYTVHVESNGRESDTIVTAVVGDGPVVTIILR